MASSFIAYHGAGFWARNYSVEMLLYLLAREARRIDNPPEWLLAAADNWHQQATGNVIGCVSPDLDEYATTSERLTVLMKLVEASLASLNKQGGMLSAGWLNSLGLGGPEICFDRDLPTEVFTRVGETLIRLLRGEITWDVHTSPVL
jgi:hypothetical protein